MNRSALLGICLAASLGATAATAGSLKDPVVEPAIVVEDASGSSSGALLVVLLSYLILIPVLE